MPMRPACVDDKCQHIMVVAAPRLGRNMSEHGELLLARHCAICPLQLPPAVLQADTPRICNEGIVLSGADGQLPASLTSASLTIWLNEHG
mmetsp:Transcript_90099/g.131859  ORF Transcript_90099/g.131859 Transcript_90099/m.131859 type:complete len:90 (+) Transcript_90099:779-1048(+)